MNFKEISAGYFWENGKFHPEPPLDIFPADCDVDIFERLIKEADGCFCLAFQRGERVFAAVDRIRSLPLFYAEKNGDLLISQNAVELWEKLGKPAINEAAMSEFLLTGYSCRDETLIPQIRQLEAGQLLVWDKLTQNLEVREYFRYGPVFEPSGELLSEMDSMHEQVFARLIESAAGRTLAIPLSGGLDSRLIAVMLKRLRYPNVVCYTFGNANQGESLISRQVAKFLNLPWQIVETNRRDWYQAFQSAEMKRYFRFGANLSSLPHVHDWIAVKTLKERNLIPNDALIVPGHSGGMLQGAGLPRVFENKAQFTARELSDIILRDHHDLWQVPTQDIYKLYGEKLQGYLKIPAEIQAEIAAGFFDAWDWRQRQSKLFVNSLRIYDFFGFEWRMPLWDRQYLDFWLKVPLEQRMRRGLMNRYVQKYQAIPLPAFNVNSPLNRLRNRYQRAVAGNLPDQRYGRFLDYRDRQTYLNTNVSSLLVPHLNYPDFINPDKHILDTNINAVQSLYYIRELALGNLE